MTEKEMIQKIYEVIKLVDCLQYNPSVDFNYLRAKGAYNIIKNRIEHIESENAELKATTSKMETVEKELRARLEKAAILPCKVGDKVYWVEDDPNTLGICEFTVQGFSFRTDDDSGLRAILEVFLEPCIDYYKNKNLFFDRAAAEARLAELRGGTDEL